MKALEDLRVTCQELDRLTARRVDLMRQARASKAPWRAIGLAAGRSTAACIQLLQRADKAAQ